MTDNLDPNDLSWLDDPNGKNEGDFAPDWELPSLDIGDPLDQLTPGSEDDFAGLFDDAPGVPIPNELAQITQEIPSWLQASAPESESQEMNIVDLVPLGQPATSDTEGIPSWLDTQEMAAAPIANKDDVPPWLAEADETSEQAFSEAAAQSDSQPTVAAGDQASNLPAWLQDADDLGAADANAFESSFDDLDFDVDPQAAGGLSDPFGGLSEPSTSAVFGSDVPDWMRTREQAGLPQNNVADFLSDMPTLPGETTDPLLSNLLQSGGASGDADLDLLSLLEQTDGGNSVRTGMLTPIEGRGGSPSEFSDDDFPDFATLLAQPDPTPEYHPMLDEPSPLADVPFDLSMLRIDDPQASQSADDSASFDFSQFDMADAQESPPMPSAAVLPPDDPAPLKASPSPAQKPASPKPRVADDDFDSFLTALQDDELAYESRPSNSEPLDLSALLRDPGFGDLTDTPQAVSDNAPVMPEFLRDVSVREASIAALLRQQQDIPLDELPEELRALHDELAAIQQSPLPAETKLPTLPIAPLSPSSPRPLTVLSDSQRRGAELLRSLASVTGVATDNPTAAVQATQKRTQRRRFGINATRLLIAACLTVAVILPFISDADVLKAGIQPPAVFAPSSTGGQAYSFIEALPTGSLVLVSADYSPGSIAELDALSEPLLRHLFVRGLKPVVISSDPVTLQHVGRLVDELGQGRQRNLDYVIGRYVLGEAVGTQDFVQNIGVLLRRDINGLPTELNVSDFNAFAGVIILTDRADTVRVWAEQAQPRMRVPLTFAVSAGAAPLSAPYAASSSDRLLIGLRDGITYARQLDAQYPPGTFVVPTLMPPSETPSPLPPSATPLSEITPSPSPDATEATPDSTPAMPATLEGEPTVTLEATKVTPTPDPLTATATPTDKPTIAPTATSDGGNTQATPEPTLSLEVFAVITGTDRVNIRQGPGTNFQILTSAAPGDRFRVVSGSSDGQWLQIELPDERIGWVSAARAQIEQGESGLPGLRVGAGGLYQTQSLTLNTERRWSAVSLGAIVAAVLIGLGSIVGVLQIILRRRR